MTIAPTRECNFACPYCYEPDRDVVYMSDKTEKNIISFMKRFPKVDRIIITWYGGEPLLAFDRILSMNTKIADLKIPYESIIITNGYLLNQEVIDRLEELKTGRIQITLDGCEGDPQQPPLYHRRRGKRIQLLLRTLIYFPNRPGKGRSCCGLILIPVMKMNSILCIASSMIAIKRVSETAFMCTRAMCMISII